MPPDLPASPTGRFPGAEVFQPLTADQIARHDLPDAKIGRRGYSKQHVNVFLHRIARETRQREDLLARTQAAAAHYAHRADELWHDAGGEGAAPRPEPVSDVALRMLDTVQQQADQVIADARAQAHQIVVDAQVFAQRAVDDAQRQVNQAAQEYWEKAGPAGTLAGEAAERERAWQTALGALAGARQVIDGLIDTVTAAAGAVTVPAGPAGTADLETTRPIDSAQYAAHAVAPGNGAGAAAVDGWGNRGSDGWRH
jgi:hypothetical protein